MRKVSPFLGILAFGALLAFISPWARVLQVNVLLMMGFFMAATYVSGVWIVQAWRDKVKAYIFMKDSFRTSFKKDSLGKSAEGAGGRIPAFEALPYDGYLVPGISMPDKSLAVVPASSVEQFSDVTTLVYAHTTPLKNPKQLKALVPIFPKNAETSALTAFSLEKGTRSEARFGFYDSLSSPVTSENLMEFEQVINTKTGNYELQEQVESGPEHNTKWIKKMIDFSHKRSAMERAKAWVLGDRKTESQANKPSQREPNG